MGLFKTPDPKSSKGVVVEAIDEMTEKTKPRVKIIPSGRSVIPRKENTFVFSKKMENGLSNQFTFHNIAVRREEQSDSWGF